MLCLKESLKSKFRFDDLNEGEVVEKKISLDFETLIGSFKNIIVFIISINPLLLSKTKD